ncbi:MAG: protein kinase, partial [Ktedonobacteraceae bacterium]|nr:protein kinase [Ktedonobacteraceae bacterium]
MTQSTQVQGRMIGRYRLARLLGRGGMGEVWLADDTQLRRQVAIKLLRGVLAKERDYREMFEREARAAAALEHPHVLPVYDYGEFVERGDEVITYLVMPYVSGGTLRDRLRAVRGPLSPQEGLSYLRQAAEAIDFAHSKQLL